MIIPAGNVRVVMEDFGCRVCVHQARGGFEPESLALWSRLSAPGRVMLDIGAYTGIYSLVAAASGATAIAFEPLPLQAERIRDNAAMNGLDVMVHRMAASDVNGFAMIGYNSNIALTSGASLEGAGAFACTAPVMTVTVDAVASTINVFAIKIDVERHEAAVLRGALQTIERWRPKMLIETLTEQARDEVAALLPDYELAVILDGRNSFFTPR